MPLTRFGVDSLGALWLKHRVEQLLGVDVPLAELLAHPTVEVLADGVLAQLHAPPPAALEAAAEFEEGVL